MDHHFNERDEFSARYSRYNVNSSNSRGAGGLSAPTASANLSDTDQVVAFSKIASLSPRLVNEKRGQFWNSNLKAPPSDPIRTGSQRLRSHFFWTLSGSPTSRLNKLAELTDNISYQAVQDRVSLQRRHEHVSAVHTRELFVFVTHELP